MKYTRDEEIRALLREKQDLEKEIAKIQLRIDELQSICTHSNKTTPELCFECYKLFE